MIFHLFVAVSGDLDIIKKKTASSFVVCWGGIVWYFCPFGDVRALAASFVPSFVMAREMISC